MMEEVQSLLQDLITRDIKTVLEQFSKSLAKKFNLELDEVLSVWNDSVDVVKLSPTTVSESVSKSSGDTNKCQASLKSTKGPRSGQLCGANISKKSTTGKYCGRHLSNEGGDKKSEKGSDGEQSDTETKSSKSKSDKNTCSAKVEKTGKACTCKVSDKSTTGSYCSKHLSKEKESSKKEDKKVTKLVLRKDSKGRFVDNETKFVFRPETKEVEGKVGDDDEVHSLSEDDIELCLKMKFKYKLPDKDEVKKKLEELPKEPPKSKTKKDEVKKKLEEPPKELPNSKTKKHASNHKINATT